jgi:polyketide biosynthesis enoyl-CoA hydratase PksI
VSSARFAATSRGEGIVSLCIATDDNPYLGPSWIEELVAALDTIARDAAVRVIMLEGSQRYFCAGASQAMLSELGAMAGYSTRLISGLLDLPVAAVAAAEGHAIGGGLLVALWCDAVVLAEERLYGANFAALGFSPGMGSTYMMTEAFGGSLGRELLFTGRLITGREIREMGCPLSHAVQPQAQVYARALAIAQEIADVPRTVIQEMKRQHTAQRRALLQHSLRLEEDAQTRLFADPAIRADVSSRYPVALEPDPDARA